MKITLEDTPLATVPYLNALGRGRFETTALPVLRGATDGLPEGIDALVAAADLQGLEVPETGGDPPRLLGERLAERLEALAVEGALPPPDRTGVLLAGDLYTVPDLAKRGGAGDVRPVWEAFHARFRWVAGVAGNHDTFGDGPNATRRFARGRTGHLLDVDVVSLDGLRVGGVSGIIGNPQRLHRRAPSDFAEAVEVVLGARVDVLVLHQGPDAPATGWQGSPIVREAIERASRRELLVVCGHCHWPRPLARIASDATVLNVDARAVVLTRAGATPPR